MNDRVQYLLTLSVIHEAIASEIENNTNDTYRSRLTKLSDEINAMMQAEAGTSADVEDIARLVL